MSYLLLTLVAPLVGAWIEIQISSHINGLLASLPSWERGLKFNLTQSTDDAVLVAPLVGAWIEIPSLCSYCLPVCVAPLVGAWIEI